MGFRPALRPGRAVVQRCRTGGRVSRSRQGFGAGASRQPGSERRFAAASAASKINHFLVGLPLLLLIVLTYAPFGLISAASILVFRTPTPLNSAVLALSMLLGGVYYSTSVIPSWMGTVSQFVPLTYGLRALRRLMLEGMPLTAVAGDVFMLLVCGVALWCVGLAAFGYGLRYSRRAGTLSHY